MAAPNRSPSPVITRPTNPNLRASETNSSIRRSFTGNPFSRPSVVTNPRSFVPNTPANSPADFGRKLSVGKEGSSRGFEEKENDKVSNSKGSKCKSPAKGGSKNFMSPTISAASKFTPSPRKKILGERNESVRTSISFSDGKESSVEDFDAMSEMGFSQKSTEGSSKLAGSDKEEVFQVPSVPKSSKRVTFSDEVLLDPGNESESLSDITLNSDCGILELISYNKLHPSSLSPSIAYVSKGDTFSETPINSQQRPQYISELTTDSDSVVVDSCLNASPFSSSVIAPLDADPLFPPYDPKTNYLSPRPQFLRYKPNPRIEGFLNKEKCLNFDKEVEDSFAIMSASSSDTDASEETQLGDSQNESEDRSTETLALEEELVLSEQSPTNAPISSQMVEQELEAKRASKPWFFTRSKCISMLMVLLIACVSISVTDISIIGSPVIKDSRVFELYESSELAVFARKRFNVLARNFQMWYESSENAIFAREHVDEFFRKFESSEILVHAKECSDGFARNVKEWSSQTISYLSKLIPHRSEVDKSVSAQFCNLTGLQEHALEGRYLEVNHHEIIAGIHDDHESEPIAKGEAKLENKAHLENVDKEHNEEGSEAQGSTEIDCFDCQFAIMDLEQTDAALHSNIKSEDQLNSEDCNSEPEIEALEVFTPISPTESTDETKSSTSNFVESKREEGSEVQCMAEINEEQLTIQAANYFASSEEILGLEPIDTAVQNDKRVNDQLNLPASEAEPELQAPEVATLLESSEENKPDIVSPMKFQVNDDAKSDESKYNVADGNTELSTDTAISETASLPTYMVEDKLSVHTMIGTSILVLAIVAALIFTYIRQGKIVSSGRIGVVPVNPKLTTKTTLCPVLSEHVYQGKLFPQSSPTDSDMVGESCPSEMSSSSYKASSYSKGSLKGTSDTQSQERNNTKRESLASSSESSTGSPSYGSFTTYERIPIKHASGDEELVTPVRRSSRIRKKVTSPVTRTKEKQSNINY